MLGDIKVDAISGLDALDVLTPIWTTKPGAARRVDLARGERGPTSGCPPEKCAVLS